VSDTNRPGARHLDNSTATLDPDVLAELEREQEFLLRSLDDLDAELAAGDMEDDDYQALADDYTRRLAEVTRSIEDERTAFADVDNRLSSLQRFGTIAAVVVLAVVAGLFLARASGFRSPTGTATGDIRQSSAGLLAEADTLTREGRWDEAVEVYDEALEVAPGNAEALTYRGWLTARLGDSTSGLEDVLEAVGVDPDFPDARVFAAILLNEQARFDEAAAQLSALDELEVPEQMQGLLAASDLRVSIAAGRIRELFQAGEPIDISELSVTLDEAARAGAVLSQQGEVVAARATFDAVLDEDPQQIVALVGKGQIARDPNLVELDPEIAADALAALDQAVELAPEEAVIRLYRADARLAQDDPDGARADLLEIDRSALSPELQGLYDAIEVELG